MQQDCLEIRLSCEVLDVQGVQVGQNKPNQEWCAPL
jgi:hypothetical protein